MATKQQIRSLLDSSGFPFQSAVTERIRSTENDHNYWVCLSEHPWKNRVTSEFGFIDLVIERGTVRMVVECKRAKGGTWLFTVPHDSEPKVQTARLHWTGKTASSKSGVAEFELSPPSYQSRECIIRGQDDDNRTLLERLSSKLLSSIDALMYEDSQTLFSGDAETYVYIPCIVTSAELVVSKVNPIHVSLDDGTVSDFDYEFVDFVKFRKSLVMNLSPGASPVSLGESNADKERSVLIVNSKNLNRTLNQVAVNLLRHRSPQLWAS